MKNAEIKELSNKELAARIREERAGLTKLVLNHAISPVENPNYQRKQKINCSFVNRTKNASIS